MENRILRNTFRAQLLAFVLSSLASAIGTMVDGVIIGQCLGMDSIAAFGLVSPLMIAFALGGAVVSSGARNRFTHLVGSGEVRQAQGVFSLACVLSVGVGTAMMAVCLVFASPIVRMLGATGNAAWYAFPVTQLLMLLFYCAVVQISRRRSGFPGSAGFDLALLLPQDFDAGEEDRMDRSIRSMEEVAALSQEVWAFCDAHGCDARRRYLLSLAVEEMAGNVVEHGFTKDQKTHSLDVRILKKGEDYILRMRDDCVFFDPLKRLQLYSPDDPLHHVGLRMIIKTASSVQYTSILKLNNLVVKI